MSEIETQIERLLTKFDSLTRPDLVLELRGYEETAIAGALDNLLRDERISVEEDEKGVKTFKKTAGFLNALQHYSTSSRY